MENMQKLNLTHFENAVSAKDYELAYQCLIELLKDIDQHFGMINQIDFDYPSQLENLEYDKTLYFCTRVANTITDLFSDPNLHISKAGAITLLSLQRWISLIFASSPYVNADHILQKYNVSSAEDSTFNLPAGNNMLHKFCVLYLPESNITLNLDVIWQLDPELCASLCFALQSPRFIGTQASFSKRAAILQWFPEKLAEFDRLDALPSSISHDVYMHCSYDVAENKHLVKKALNKVIRQHLLNSGWQDREITEIGYKNSKPVMVVLLEHFYSAHSIYRTHSTSITAAREKFHIIGVGNSAVDEAGRAIFDEFYLREGTFIADHLQQLKTICEKEKAAVLYMPSIGMDLTNIFASNIRIAPIQAIALGHPATTHSDFIEYVIVEDDYVGSEDCFSETLLRLPKDALPYVPSALAPTEVEYNLRENPEVVNIGIASTTMKLNPYFLEALKTIRDRANVKVHFHFALGQSMGITHPYVARFIKSYLGEDATAHPHAPYDQYLQILHNCDMMLNPFPFGNTNGIIDMITLGLVGVCKSGEEVHEHIDEGLFKRLELPEWLITHSTEEYITCAIRLAENHKERLSLRRKIIKHNGLKKLFTGDPTPMGKVLYTKVEEWAEKNNIALPTS